VVIGPGSRVGVYEIGASLGAGGMGEVFRARDTRLGRDVAIKCLPDLFARDPDRLARFEREARALAALNHPHIAHLYGIEESGGIHALVMELVEGPTLADRIAAGPIPVAETIHIARQMADALACAHEAGIVHRDLKPANVKVREDGTVKVLDFGLAKATGAEGGRATDSPSLDNSPTLTTPLMTERGLILGTAAYMAPEQARGKVVDHRADVWAFGVIVFEMLTGRQLFRGETVSDTLAALLREDIPWTALPAIPPALRRLLERCLQKDAKRRLHSIVDATFDLDEAAAAPVAGIAVPVAAARPWPARLGWIVAALLAGVSAIAIWQGQQASPAESRWQQFTQVTDMEGEETWPSLSPDGKSVAYASRARGTSDIYVLRVGGRNPVLVAGDAEIAESGPAFAPDGQTIAYHHSGGTGGIFVSGATGESSRRLTDFGFHPAWSPDGKQIAFSTEELTSPYGRLSNSVLWVVDLAGGAPRKIQDADAAQPAWSPSGARIAFWANHSGGQRDLFTIPAGGGARVAVLQDAAVDWSPAWSPDGRYLYFSSDRGGGLNLWRIAIEESSGRPHGAPEPVTAGVQASFALPSLSRDGARLAFRSRLETVNPLAVPLDPGAPGVPIALSARNGTLRPSDVSFDGRHMLFDGQGGPQEDILIGAPDGSGLRRLTDDAARDRRPRFMPDGKSVVFYSNRDGRWKIWSIRVDGGGLRPLVAIPDVDLIYPVLSPSADRLVATSIRGSALGSYLSDLRDGSASPPRKLPGTLAGGQFFQPTDWSRDGLRLAGMVTAENGSLTGVGVYDMASAAMTVVSGDPTAFVRWLADNRRIVYVEATNRQLVVVDVDTRARVATALRSALMPSASILAVSPDGRTVYVGGEKAEADIWIVERR
jgi:Tol biopolymer transport system component/tRNA A-37 threonylcarbamoyl transferase component Bud32